MKKLFPIVVILLSACSTKNSENQKQALQTFCNPINLSYRFCLDEPSRREAADPTIILFKDKYYLFASKSGGYWNSDDLLEWNFIQTEEIPVEEYAPTAIALGDTLYFLASSNEKSTIYKTADPASGKWTVAREQLEVPVWDPAFFLDDDKRLFLYWGCSNQNPLYGVEVDYRKKFDFIGKPIALLHADTARHGWEIPGDYNEIKGRAPWIEGAWVNKINDKFYLQYSGPGTEFKSYADGVYTSSNPLGPYTLAEHNPFASRPEGFIAGAGHGSTFEDKFGNFWHIGTGTISVKHMFERRLVLFPAFVDSDGILYADTRFGDYPMHVPNKKFDASKSLHTGWMLLSFKKNVEVSSAIDTLSAANMTDEDIRTYWAAKTGGSDEFAVIDLGAESDVYAVQLNFAEHNTNIFGRKSNLFHRYVLESSNDKKNWSVVVDMSANANDNSHPYHALREKINCRYLRLKNVEVPDGSFALSGFRVFGKGSGKAPGAVSRVDAVRNTSDRKSVKLQWEPSHNATGYMVRYGISKDKMYHSYMVYDDTSVAINSLHADKPYFFSIDSFNENGVTEGTQMVKAE